MKERRAKEKILKEKEKARVIGNKCKRKTAVMFSPAAAAAIATDTCECPSTEPKNSGANTSFDEQLTADRRTSSRTQINFANEGFVDCHIRFGSIPSPHERAKKCDTRS